MHPLNKAKNSLVNSAAQRSLLKDRKKFEDDEDGMPANSPSTAPVPTGSKVQPLNNNNVSPTVNNATVQYAATAPLGAKRLGPGAANGGASKGGIRPPINGNFTSGADVASGKAKLPPTPPPKAPLPASIDPEVEAALRAMLGKRDTTGEEAFAKQQVEKQLGSALVDSRARSGLAGFGLSGAAQAAEGDLRGKAADQVLAQVFGIQKGARDEDFRNLGLATDALGDKANRELTGTIEQEKNQTNNREVNVQEEAWRYLLENPELFGLPALTQPEGNTAPAIGGAPTVGASTPTRSPSASGATGRTVNDPLPLPSGGATGNSFYRAVPNSGGLFYGADGKYYR